jgi:DNA-binding transcriptional LysR family regulator
VQGLGISIMCEWFVREQVKQGQLKVILEDYRPTMYDIHAVYPERKFVPQKVKQMIEFLREKIKG